MNSVEERAALIFYLTTVFSVDQQGELLFCSDVWPFLIYFLTYDEAVAYYTAADTNKFRASGYRRIKDMFVQLVAETYGSGRISKDKQGREVIQMKLRYDFTEVPYQITSQSDLRLVLGHPGVWTWHLQARHGMPIAFSREYLALPHWHIKFAVKMVAWTKQRSGWTSSMHVWRSATARSSMTTTSKHFAQH